MGGLRLRKLDLMNKACILKLGWQLQPGAKDFWCEVMRGKYKCSEDMEDIVARSLSSSLWKAIVKLWPNLIECCFWSLGDGRSVEAWNSIWINLGVRVNDMNLQIPDDIKHAKVVDLVSSSDTWNWSVMENWMLISIMQKIAGIPPPNNSCGADKHMCVVGDSEKYLVAGMYKILCNFQQHNDDPDWRSICKLRVPERVRHFVWIMWHDRLLTNYNKSRMDFCSAMCGFCGCIIESTLHVMRDCPLVMPLWLNVVHLTARDDLFNGDMKQWLVFNMSREVGWKMEVEWKDFWAMACHCLWFWRNKENHEEHFHRPHYPSHHVLKLIREYHKAEKANKVVMAPPPEIVLIGWKPLLEGWVKLNTDDSCRDNGLAGCGGVIRGNDGEWLGGFAKGVGMCSAYMAEFWEVFEGLKYARRLGFKAVELNVDSLVVSNVLSNHEHGSLIGRSLVVKIHQLLELEWEVVVHHSYREVNKCADALANFGCSLNADIVYYETSPTQLYLLVDADVRGFTSPRLVAL